MTATQINAPAHRLRQQLGARSSFKDGYSPIFCMLTKALLLILQLQRHLFHSRRRCTFQAAHQIPLQHYAQASILWQRHHPLHSCADAFLPLLARTHDILSSLRTYVLTIIKSLHQLRGMMHGRLRTDWRMQQSERIAHMESLWVGRHFKRMFRHIHHTACQYVSIRCASYT